MIASGLTARSGFRSIGKREPRSSSGTNAGCRVMPSLLGRRRSSNAYVNESAAGLMDVQIAATLTAEGYQTPGLIHPITSKIVCHLREKWQIPTVKLNRNQHNPTQWEDGTYSVEGAAAKLGVDQSTIFNWLKTGRLKGEHLARSMPWKIYLTEEDVIRLHEWPRRARRSKKEAL